MSAQAPTLERDRRVTSDVKAQVPTQIWGRTGALWAEALVLLWLIVHLGSAVADGVATADAASGGTASAAADLAAVVLAVALFVVAVSRALGAAVVAVIHAGSGR